MGGQRGGAERFYDLEEEAFALPSQQNSTLTVHKEMRYRVLKVDVFFRDTIGIGISNAESRPGAHQWSNLTTCQIIVVPGADFKIYHKSPV